MSLDGKKAAEKKSIEKLDIDFLKSLCFAIERSKNLISITDVRGKDLPDNVDILTYSFPCQDLSVAGY
ncbi:C-5 cytosine-specific DNA methylase [compost metagenome]